MVEKLTLEVCRDQYGQRDILEIRAAFLLMLSSLSAPDK